MQAAIDGKRSLPPDAVLPGTQAGSYLEMRIRVSNETTLRAGSRFAREGCTPVALNFASGVHPGGGFLKGAWAQEEVLCRSSALYLTLIGDPMYEAHCRRPRPDSTQWAIYSPDVPVFRDDGSVLERPWPLSFITCAAPVAKAIGQPAAADMLRERIRRVLAIARGYGHACLVLGAWGCGAFGNDPQRTARDFRKALEGEFQGAFSDVAFAIADWSPNRQFLAPSCEAFS